MTAMNVKPVARPGNGNGGIVPPWLQKPPVIVLPVMPDGWVAPNE